MLRGTGAAIPPPLLVDGFNHVAILTNDTDRLHAFYEEVFAAEVQHEGLATGEDPGQVRMSVIHVGPHSELNVFQVVGNTEADRQTPMFGRGRLDHLALQAASLEDFEEIRRPPAGPGRGRRLRHRLRPGPQPLLPRSRRPRVRGLRRQPRRGPRGGQPARHPRRPLPGRVVKQVAAT